MLGDVPVTDAQVAAVRDWVTAGGDLILMRPDSRFNGLAGLTAQTGTVSEGYIAVNAGTAPGAGITTDTMQFHGPANRYTPLRRHRDRRPLLLGHLVRRGNRP